MGGKETDSCADCDETTMAAHEASANDPNRWTEKVAVEEEKEGHGRAA